MYEIFQSMSTGTVKSFLLKKGSHKERLILGKTENKNNVSFRFKVLNSLLEMEGRPRIHHPLSVYLEMTKDKNGLIKTRLKIPYWSRQEPQPPVDLSDEDICIIGKKEINFKI